MPKTAYVAQRPDGTAVELRFAYGEYAAKHRGFGWDPISKVWRKVYDIDFQFPDMSRRAVDALEEDLRDVISEGFEVSWDERYTDAMEWLMADAIEEALVKLEVVK